MTALNLAQSGAGYFVGSWDQATSTLKLVCGSNIEAAAHIEITLESLNQITLPQTGIKLNQATVTISTNTPNLPASAGPMRSVEAVGVFFSSSMIFDPKLAGSAAKLSITFRANGRIRAGDILLLQLPAFTGGSAEITNLNSITTVNGEAHIVFCSATWIRSVELLTLFATGTLPDTLQTVIVQGLRLPASGVAGNQSGIALTCKCTETPLVDFVPAHISFIPRLFSGLSVNSLPARQFATAPQSDGVVLQLGGGDGVLESGDLVALRSLSSTCYESRLNQASTARSPDMVVSANLQFVLNSKDLFVGTYAICYGRKYATWVANVGVDSETGLEVVIQDAITSAKVGAQSWGSALEGPRNDFILTMQSAVFSARLTAGDAVSIVSAIHACSDAAYSSALAPSNLFSALAIVSSLPQGLSVSLAWPGCAPVGSPPVIGGVCPDTGIYRLCFRDNNVGIPEETGVSIIIHPVELFLTVDNNMVQFVDATFSPLTVSLKSGGVPCCEGSKVLISLLQRGQDKSSFLYSSASNSHEEKIAISQNGVVVFTDLNIRSLGGRDFALRISVPNNITVDAQTFTLLPHHLSVVSDLTGEHVYGLGSATATLPTIRVAMMDTQNQVLTNIILADNFSVVALLQTGGSGSDSSVDSNYRKVWNDDDLLPDSVRSNGQNADAGVVEFSGDSRISLRRQAGQYFRIKFSLTLNDTFIVYGGPFTIAPGSIRLDILGNATVQQKAIVQLGLYPYGACAISLAATKASCAGYSALWLDGV